MHYIVHVHIYRMREVEIKTYQALLHLYGLIRNNPIIIK